MTKSFRYMRGKVFLIFIQALLIFILLACSEVLAPSDTTPPSTPLNFTLLGGGDGQARFRWTKNTEQDFKGYILYRSIENLNNFIVIVETIQNEYLDRFLEYDSVYYYYITAKDGAGNESDPSPIISIQPLNIAPPVEPTFLLASGSNIPVVDIKEIVLKWLPPDIGDLREYIIYRGLEKQFEVNTSSYLGTSPIATFRDKNVDLNMTYYYKVVAVDKGDKYSLPSKPSNDMVLSSPQIVSPSNQSIFTSPFLFEWMRVENAEAYEVYVGNGPFSDVFWHSEKTQNLKMMYSGPQFTSSKVYYWWVAVYSRENIILENGIIIPAEINSYSSINSFFSE